MAGGLIPIGILYCAKQIVDLIAQARKQPSPDAGDLWFWLGAEFALAGTSQLIGRAVDLCDSVIADRFFHSLGLKIMDHAMLLDLPSFEDPAFHDRLEWARA